MLSCAPYSVFRAPFNRSRYSLIRRRGRCALILSTTYLPADNTQCSVQNGRPSVSPPAATKPKPRPCDGWATWAAAQEWPLAGAGLCGGRGRGQGQARESLVISWQASMISRPSNSNHGWVRRGERRRRRRPAQCTGVHTHQQPQPHTIASWWPSHMSSPAPMSRPICPSYITALLPA